MINEFYIYSRWEKLDDILQQDSTYKDNRFRIEALSIDGYSHVFLADNRKGEKRIFIEFDKAEIFGYTPTQVNGLDIAVSDNHQISDSLLYLSIALSDLVLEEAFLALTTSIILGIRECDNSFETMKTVEKIIKRYTDFFSKKLSSTLSNFQEQGLFAELYELLHQIDTHGEEAIKSWEGPEKRRRDFVFADYEIEVKSTTKLNDSTITVTSEKQLEPLNVPLYLHLHILEKSNTGLTIIELIENIINQVKSIQYQRIFTGKIFLLGIDKDFYEAKESYRVVSSTRYLIDDDFPRIKAYHIPNEVFEIKYKLDLKSIKGASLKYD